MKLRRQFESYRVFLLDGDGVLWRGERPISSALRAVRELIRAGRIVVLVTNNSTKSRDSYRAKLLRLGVDLPLARIYSSSYGAARYAAEMGFREAYVVGERGLLEELELAGIKALWPASCVIAGMDRGFNYEKLRRASSLVREGAYFIATNRDPTLPTEEGLIPGAGSIVAAIEVASGRQADVTIGKPEPYLYELALNDLDANRGEVLAIGDRLDTDIEGAARAGIDSALVLTGVASLEDVKRSTAKPRYVLRSLLDMFE